MRGNRPPDAPSQALDDERGLSDTIGFVLTFAVIIASVGLVSTFGMTALTELQTSEQQTNAERSFQVIAENVEELESSNAPRRRSEIDLNEGSLFTANETELQIEVTVPGASPNTITERIYPQSLQYELDESRVAYEGGAIFRNELDGGSVMRRSPEVICRPNRAIVSFVSFTDTGNLQITGSTVRVTSVLNSTELIYPRNRTGTYAAGAASDVTITVASSNNQDAWDDYFTGSETGWEAVTGQPNTYRCANVDSVMVRKTNVNMVFVR
jgi:hypothetical protein